MTTRAQMTSTEQAAVERDLMREVAQFLRVLTKERAWTAVDVGRDPGNNEAWEIHGPDNRRIHLGLNWRDPDKIVLRGILERNPPVHGSIAFAEGNPEIQVSRARGAAVIAKEIVRRVLPGYEEVFLKNRERIRSANEYAGQVKATRVRMAAAFGVTPSRSEGEAEQFWAGSTRVQCGGQTVTLEMRSLPVELAVKIAELVRDYKGTK